MMHARRVFRWFALFVAFGACTAHASTSSSEITEMWWNPGETGWGVNVVLQRDVAFLTFFVYDAMGNPVWYTSDAQLATTGLAVWTGKLYATNGPWFGGPFAAGNVNVRRAGSVSFTLSALDQAELTYTVDGITVTKNLQRQTWTNEDYSGGYLGGYSIANTNCFPAHGNGIEEVAGLVAVAQNGSAISITVSAALDTCTFGGAYSQTGKLGQVNGNYSCTSGVQGSFALVEMTPTISGFTGRIVGRNQSCDFAGALGGVRRAQ
ncbi:MAG TPA: hypothetical protein VLN42_11260 [Casimicrobiaceae bacterium]|nr:hypothetical protein [Casimicrobiaceae bacterium]